MSLLLAFRVPLLSTVPLVLPFAFFHSLSSSFQALSSLLLSSLLLSSLLLPALLLTASVLVPLMSYIALFGFPPLGTTLLALIPFIHLSAT